MLKLLLESWERRRLAGFGRHICRPYASLKKLLFVSLTPLLVLQSPCFAVTIEDTVMKAMTDEMDRSLARLHLDGHSPPYYISYDSTETDRFEVNASLGSLTSRSHSRWRSLEPTVRVGNYEFDSSKFYGDAPHTTGSSGLTIDNNYDAIRRKIWLSTDNDYKSAVETLEEKKAHFKRNNIDNKFDDFSKEEPEVSISKARPLIVDEAKWTDCTKRISAIFREYPQIQLSIANFRASVSNRCFVSSEKVRIVDDTEDWLVTIAASTQAKDGERIKDMEVFGGHTEQDLPGFDQFEKRARELANRLIALQAAPTIEDYDGPVLFEDQAAAEFMEQMLCDNLSSQPESLSADTVNQSIRPFADKIGKKILPRQLSVVDEPFAREYNGAPLFGGYNFDVQGVRAKRVVLISKGVLKALCTDRSPTKYSQHSNGHSNGYGGSTSIVFVTSDSKNTREELINRGKELAKEADLPYFLIAKRLLDPNAFTMLNMPDSTLQGSSLSSDSTVILPKPVILVKHWVDTDKEEMVRGARFEPITVRALRDIDMIGSDAQASMMGRGGDNWTHLISPSFIIKSMEVNKDSGTREKPPLLENPLSENK
jgi:predicted Zn-dependent protease